MQAMNFLMAGVGGQGVIRFSQILGDVLFHLDYDVKKAEVHGMSQRGGAVNSHLKAAPRVYSPIIENGTADFLISMELLETYRNRDIISEKGMVISSTYTLETARMAAGLDDYPSDLTEKLKEIFQDRIILIPTLEIAKELGNLRLHNTILLGKLAANMAIPKDKWLASIKNIFPEKVHELNEKAFSAGYQYQPE